VGYVFLAQASGIAVLLKPGRVGDESLREVSAVASLTFLDVVYPLLAK
jgi:hypothetical protein